MSAKKKSAKKKTNPAVHAATVIALLATSAYLTVELREEDQNEAPGIQAVAETPQHGGKRTWERLKNPDRTVLRDEGGQVLATFTDNARTATLKGPSRTFAEPAATTSKVVTEDWVRLMPKPWRKGAENEQWFKDWFRQYRRSKEDDIFAMAFQYLQGAPVKKDDKGIPYAGDADFAPVNRNRQKGAERRIMRSDFYHYLGIPYTFNDGTTVRPDTNHARSVDGAGYQRLVWGYRAHYPLAATDAKGDGLPRTANGMARSRIGADIIPLKGAEPAHRPTTTDLLQPGDLVFFKLNARTKDRLDHVGIYLGHDTDGHQIFVSSREEGNGPTIGDKGGTSRLDGNGYYARTLRSAKRL